MRAGQSRRKALKEDDGLPLAPTCDLRALDKLDGSPLEGPRLEAFVERLTLIYSGEYEVSEVEVGFWRRQFAVNPFLRFRAGAMTIRQKVGPRERIFPGQDQLEMIQWFEKSWMARIRAELVILKVRQNGISTASAMILACCILVYPDTFGHIIANLDSTAGHLLGMVKFAVNNMVPWDRPKSGDGVDNKDEFGIEDAEFGIRGVLVRRDSAELRDKIGLGRTIQWAVRSEPGQYADAEAVYGSVMHAEVKEWPSFAIHESQGHNRTDVFGRMYDEIKAHPLPGQLAMFMAWFNRFDAFNDLPVGVTEEMFWNGNCDLWQGVDHPKLLEKFRSFQIPVRRAVWYLTEWRRARQRGRRAVSLFPVHVPWTEDDAFYAPDSTVFDPDILAVEVRRCESAVPVRMAVMGEKFPSACPKGCLDPEWKPRFFRADLFTDEVGGYKKPLWVPNEFGGEYMVYECPRSEHAYVIPCDLAEGGSKRAKVRDPDDTAVGVMRWTYDEDLEEPRIVTCALSLGLKGEVETAEHAFALSVLYGGGVMGPAPIIFERNNQGKTFVENVKRVGDGRENWYYAQVQGEDITDFDRIGIQVTRGLTGEQSKVFLVTQAARAHELGRVWILSREVVGQMGRYQELPGKTYAGVGSHDDAVSWLYLGLEACRYASQQSEPIAVAIAGEGGLFGLSGTPTESELSARDKRLELEFQRDMKRIGAANLVDDPMYAGVEGADV